MNILKLIPSFLELEILSYSDFCIICNIATKHEFTNCCDCDKILCFNHISGIYSLYTNGGIKPFNYICLDCRISRSLRLDNICKTFLLNC